MKIKYFEEKNTIISELKAVGVSEEQAEVVADCFVTADEYGVTSHGINVLQAHVDKVKRGGYNLNPSLKIVRQSPAFAVVDGDNGFGPVSADYCMNLAVERAKKVGVFQVFSKNNNTVGPAFYYPLKAAEQGCIGILFSNSPAQMAPFGGKEKLLGTNPFSAVIPVPGYDPIIVDMATSVVAKSKFKQYKEAGKRLPDGWALDEDGKPTNDPDEGMKGLVLPMAGFKGYSIAMLIDLISGLVSGAAYLNNVGRFYSVDNKRMNVGFCCIAIDPKVVLGEEYASAIAEYVATVRNSKRSGEGPVCVPGDDRLTFYKNNM
ncbi:MULTISPECIES: Ldh family oxidoreductase [Bacteroides]|uniref:Ldh family oxidoreductase n=1 Tax=Bacteroides TaxID=816 RepID=UPI00033A7B02|nr:MULTISPECIES: Ldh family oxidoreductase [Bacteroides]QUT74867.1 putative oxidoreductase YjmC [Bacteroides salyersiae]UYU46507.1 Ldh family oxidoreductase [Bacteroides salyersiae]CCY49842.1 (R)-2-hydroxyacid dehydrogenase [Bacteroides sp. CAG:189]